MTDNTNETSDAPEIGKPLSELPPEVFESVFVHSVYQKIATHFSDTRYKVLFLHIEPYTLYSSRLTRPHPSTG